MSNDGIKESFILGLTIPQIAEMRADAMRENKLDLYLEIATLRAKVSFYEDRIKQMHGMMRVGSKWEG